VHDNLDAPVDLATAEDVRRLLALEHAVAELVVEPHPENVLLELLLAAVCSALHWPFGAVWRSIQLDGGPMLRCIATRHVPDLALSAFATASRETPLAPGVGLPGRVLRSGRAEWITDVRVDDNFPRALAAGQAGLAAAVCFPITSRDGLECLAEFFADTPLDPPSELLATATSLGRRVGDAIRRQRIDDAVRRSEARLRAVVESALDCVVIADGAGRVLEFNPAACHTFGYARNNAIGTELAVLIVPPELRDPHRAGFARYVETGDARVLDRRLETTGMRADGSTFPVELTITRIAVPGPPIFAAYLRDLTEPRRVEAELRKSRLRVVEATLNERQRLERDLHDGAQQRMISLGLVLARARTLLPGDAERSAAMLDDAIAHLEEAAVELRNLARGIHPSSLTRYGLSVALADVARRAPLNVTLGSLPTQRYPAPIEATAYFVVTEALTNAARHAGSARVQVHVAEDGDALQVTVSDDGPGGASLDGGTGLRGLADRVALLDGSLDVVSSPDAGTTVTARIPLPG
jgi:PAS domain S-box-containing protein